MRYSFKYKVDQFIWLVRYFPFPTHCLYITLCHPEIFLAISSRFGVTNITNTSLTLTTLAVSANKQILFQLCYLQNVCTYSLYSYNKIYCSFLFLFSPLCTSHFHSLYHYRLIAQFLFIFPIHDLKSGWWREGLYSILSWYYCSWT